MNKEHPIVQKVIAAQKDRVVADKLISQYMGFICSEVSKVTGKAPNKSDDELSVAMLAFYDAIMGYEKGKGAFLGYASIIIRNRVIDELRKENKHGKVISYDTPISTGSEETLLQSLPDKTDKIEQLTTKNATQKEIGELSLQLSRFELSLGDIADNCPRQKRTLAACHRALSFARENPNILKAVEETGKLPLTKLCEGSGIERKTLERHRKYLVALLLCYTNGYEIIRGHLSYIEHRKGGAI